MELETVVHGPAPATAHAVTLAVQDSTKYAVSA